MPKTPRGPYKKKKDEQIYSIHEIKTENNPVISDESITESKLEDNKPFLIYMGKNIVDETNVIKTDSEIQQTATEYQEFETTEYVTPTVFNFVPASNVSYAWQAEDAIVFDPQDNYDNPFDDADNADYSDDEKPSNDIEDTFIAEELVNVKMETDENIEEGECSVKLKVSNNNSGGDKRKRRKGSRRINKRGKENSSDEEDDYKNVVLQYESDLR